MINSDKVQTEYWIEAIGHLYHWTAHPTNCHGHSISAFQNVHLFGHHLPTNTMAGVGHRLKREPHRQAMSMKCMLTYGSKTLQWHHHHSLGEGHGLSHTEAVRAHGVGQQGTSLAQVDHKWYLGNYIKLFKFTFYWYRYHHLSQSLKNCNLWFSQTLLRPGGFTCIPLSPCRTGTSTRCNGTSNGILVWWHVQVLPAEVTISWT